MGLRSWVANVRFPQDSQAGREYGSRKRRKDQGPRYLGCQTRNALNTTVSYSTCYRFTICSSLSHSCPSVVFSFSFSPSSPSCSFFAFVLLSLISLLSLLFLSSYSFSSNTGTIFAESRLMHITRCSSAFHKDLGSLPQAVLLAANVGRQHQPRLSQQLAAVRQQQHVRQLRPARRLVLVGQTHNA